MKKTVGVILVLIVFLNMIAWIKDFSRGRFESPIYYIFIFLILYVGIRLIRTSNSNNK